MRKSSMILLIAATLVLSMFTQVRSVHAVSCGFERYQDADCEIYLEYLPIIPVDAGCPTASEEFAFKFYVWQEAIEITPYVFYYWPDGWSLEVFFFDECGINGWPTWKRWYPISMSDRDTQVSWGLSTGVGPVGLSTTIKVPDTGSFVTNYTKHPYNYNGEDYMRIGYLHLNYNSNGGWTGITQCEGAGSLGIPNDLGAAHMGHHAKLLFRFQVRWRFCWTWKQYIVDFVIGDDVPPDTDCLLPVAQGTTTFTATPYTPPVVPSKYRRHCGSGGCFVK